MNIFLFGHNLSHFFNLYYLSIKTGFQEGLKIIYFWNLDNISCSCLIFCEMNKDCYKPNLVSKNVKLMPSFIIHPKQHEIDTTVLKKDNSAAAFSLHWTAWPLIKCVWLSAKCSVFLKEYQGLRRWAGHYPFVFSWQKAPAGTCTHS